MKKKAIVAGHVCIDITPVFPKNTRNVKYLGDLLKPGKLIQVLSPDIHTGGAVANTGLGMKKMGADVKLIGKIGIDAFGGMVREVFKSYDAESDLIAESGETTSYSMVIAVPGIDRSFLHCPGANDTFDGTEISDEVLKDIALFHFGYPTLMKKMYEKDGLYLTSMFKKMNSQEISTSLDLAAVDTDSEVGAVNWEKILYNVLPYVDFFVPSFEELCFMLDRQRYEILSKKAGDTDMTDTLSIEEDIIPLAKKCLELGTKSVLLKCGKPGLFLMTSNKMSKVGRKLGLDAEAWNNFCHFEKSFKIDRVLSGTGAGDSSIAAFLTSILEGATPNIAIENAAAAGALCCMSYDAVSGLKPLSEIRKMINNGWEKA